MHNLYFAKKTNQIFPNMKAMPTETFKAQQVFGHSFHQLSTLRQATHAHFLLMLMGAELTQEQGARTAIGLSEN